MVAGRPFDPQHDIPILQTFLAEMRDQVAQAAYYQFGDLMWRIHNAPNGFDPTTDLRIWSAADGRVAGFVHYLAPEENPEFFLRPEHYDSPMADEMIAWAAARARSAGAAAIETSCIESDGPKAAFLARAGFRPLDDVMVFLARALDEPLPRWRLPDGYAIVSRADRPDLIGFTGNSCSHAAYAAVTNAPGYQDDLGLRVCYQDREVVAGCICWYDDVDRCGEFEPVGTVDGHRGKGLAFAVMAQAMENLKRRGANRVYVRTGKANLPAVRLYEKLGFAVTDLDCGWALIL